MFKLRMQILIRFCKAPVFALVALLVCAALPVRAEDSKAEAKKEVGTITVPAGAKLDKVAMAVRSAFLGRKWGILRDESGVIIGHLKHRKWDATLTVEFDEKQIKIYSDSWEVTDRGVRIKPDLNEGWLKNIKNDISIGLGIMPTK